MSSGDSGGVSRRVVLAGLAASVSLSASRRPALAQVRARDVARQTIEVRARTLPSFSLRDSAQRRFGLLEYISGVSLTSSFGGFGGLSALHVDPDGSGFVSLSDHGLWFSGRLVYRGAELAGMDGVETAPVLGADGRPAAARGWYDTESLAIAGGVAWVGLERVNAILRFPTFGRDGIEARGVPVAVPTGVKQLPLNKGLEALVAVPPEQRGFGGALIAISERGLDRSGNIAAFIIGGRMPGDFSLHRTGDYDVSDAALLPGGGDLLVLERKLSLLSGVGIRIRRIALAAIKPGETVDGPTIFEADLGDEIDNFEGLAIHRNAQGEVILTMISDDNFSPIQRTLMLQFKLLEP